MPQQPSKNSEKFERVFAQLDEVKIDIAKIKTWEDMEQKQLDAVIAKIDRISCQLNQIIGRESVRATIYGLIGSIVSGVVVWLISRFGG